MKENFLSYLMIFVFCRQFSPLLSYNCFYAPRWIVRNRYRWADFSSIIIKIHLCVCVYVCVCVRALV